MKSFSAAVVFFSMVGTSAWAQTSGGAFGIQQGQALSSLRVLRKIQDNFYSVAVPLPNSEFESYTVVVTPQTGVCKVAAIGKDHVDRYGYGVRSAYTEIKSTLTSRYGASKEYDFLKFRALWDEADEWVMAIKQKDRTLSSFWDAEEGSNLPSTVSSINMDVSATSSTSAYITVTYEFENFKRCKAFIEAGDNQGL